MTFNGYLDPVDEPLTSKKLHNPYVPIGSQTLTVESGHVFKAGDMVFLLSKPTQKWITSIGMDSLKEYIIASPVLTGHRNYIL